MVVARYRENGMPHEGQRSTTLLPNGSQATVWPC